ncbi:DUF3108 domain-containing protein [Flavobacterium soyangense]|uniref:Uncharacterized protein n=1 Tax=Flavobacterium soyangense TaxID=2023265 RepID=A0A930XYM7_9FLAO|nr:hypothetical protein [Flavobacterium soyangense]MBF2707988.1 hypothetical protein [Flavobacterium soyangense]
MNNLIKKITSTFIILLTVMVNAQRKDTLCIRPENLVFKNIKTGNTSYVVYNKKTKESPSERITLIKINVASITHNNTPAIAILQQWDRDTILHTSKTIFKLSDFSTLDQKSYWKRLGYASDFNFETKSINYEGKIPDSVKVKSFEIFDKSFEKYNLNWHSDLVIFTLLPYKENRTFKINFYDPGFGKPEEVFYAITNVESLLNPYGKKVKCWVMEHKIGLKNDYQKFWISQESNEIVKEEDYFNGSYRYKLKVMFSEFD